MKIEITSWNSTVKKAEIYIKCKQTRLLYPKGPLMYYYEEIKEDDFITIHHIISILLYCNYDLLQKKFSSTFRKLYINERWKSVKRRNQEYAIWSRLLRETVEIFGIPMRDIKLKKSFYHGISTELVFKYMIACFNAPTSMTTNYNVAYSFSNGSGLILEINRDLLDLCYFDCKWLSDYPNESECLLFGGYQSVKIINIYSSKLKCNYKIYIQCIHILQSMIQSINLKGNNNFDKIKIKEKLHQLIDQRVNEEKSHNNEYGTQLFRNFLKDWDKSIMINIPNLNDEKQYLFIKGFIFK